MLHAIGQISPTSATYHHSFRKAPDVSKPNFDINNIGKDSLQALASYNIAQLNLENKTKKEILKPFYVPDNIEDIKGERIYNSEGKLVEIVDEDENYKNIYQFNDTISYNLIKTDKKSNIIYQQILSGNSLYLDKRFPDGRVISTAYENNEPVQIDEYFYSNTKEQTITYLPKTDNYCVNQNFDSKNGKAHRFLDFDKDGNCIYASESTDKQGYHSEVNLNLYNGKPCSVTTTTSKKIENNINVNDIDLTHLKPYPYYNIDYKQILNTDGEKKYYSNGKLEKLIASDGKTYHFNLSGELTLLEDKDYRILFNTKEETICCSFEPNGHRVEMLLENGGKIITQNSKDEGSICAEVFYENPKTGEDKTALYKDGKLMSYKDFKNGFSVEYDENGQVCNMRKSY